MQGLIRLTAAATIAAIALSAPGAAAPLPGAAPATDLSAQSQVKRKIPQIRVTPRYRYRNYHSFYPVPYDYDYPGPNAKRECVARLVQEPRPSGTVVVPRMSCWWVGG